MAHEVRVKIDTAVVAHKDFEVVVRNDAGKIGSKNLCAAALN